MMTIDGLNFPTSLCFDLYGHCYVAESGLPFAGAPAGGRIWKVSATERTLLVRDLRAPLNGLRYHKGELLIAEGGEPGRLSKYNLETGVHSVILDGLPGGGNYHTNILIANADDKLYFGQGSATNSAIVGPDANTLSWLKRLPHPHDIPGRHIVLNAENGHVEGLDESQSVLTGPFLPYGVAAKAGQTIKAQLPCTSAVMRCNFDGSELELFAWGLRNPFGLEFLDDGRLLAVDLGMNDRGSRPIGNAPDCIFHVEQGKWYGWPDYAAGKSVTRLEHKSNRQDAPTVRHVLSNHDDLGKPATPLVTFPIHAAPTRFAVHPHTGHLYVAMFGDKRPFTAVAGPKAGRHLLKIDLETMKQDIIADLPLHRPIDLAFHPITNELYVLDFGIYEMNADGSLKAEKETGGIWQIKR